METYRDIDGNSSVMRYEIGDDFIIVEFKHGGSYLYDYHHTGANNVEEMKELAQKGNGLASFINTEVKKNFARKL